MPIPGSAAARSRGDTMEYWSNTLTSYETGLVVTTFQTVVTLLVALVLRLLAHDIPQRFLYDWAVAWLVLGVGFVAVNAAFVLGPGSPNELDTMPRPALCLYCVCKYVFAYFVWSGCRAYAGRSPFRSEAFWILVPVLGYGLVAPLIVPSAPALLAGHTVIIGGFCGLALASTRGVRPRTLQMRIGLGILRLSLLGKALLFAHYAVVMGWLAWQSAVEGPRYLGYASTFNGAAVTLLAFGMVVLASDSVRQTLEAGNRELAETNRRLAETSDQLAVAARTDPLTGLLNRRAYDAMLADRADGPFAGSVAVVDLNSLKALNDAHGHAAGDAAIQFVARALRNHFRITDPVFRMGGDEFLIVLEGGRAADLACRLEAVDTDLRGVRLPGIAAPITLVIAWGMADFDTPAEFVPAVQTADQRMYACKTMRKQPETVRG